MADLPALSEQLMSYVIAAVRSYGGAILELAQDDDREPTAELGRRLLQRIFGTSWPGEPLPEPLAGAAADPVDEAALRALRLAILATLEADPELRADVEGMLAQPGAIVTVANPPAQESDPRVLREWLAKASAKQHWYRDVAPREYCMYCARPLEGTTRCGYCGRDQTTGGYTAPSPQPSQASSYDSLVRQALAELVQPGRLLFNPPDRMQLNRTERVEVRLTRTLERDAELVEQLRGHGEPQLEQIPTAPLMAVTLKGDGFRIVALSDEEQGVTQDSITTWEFDIRALKRGEQRLIMCVSLRIPVPGQPLEHKSIPVREATIDVQVAVPTLVGHFVSGNWQWFIGTAVAIAAVVAAVLYH
jgi:hypothetical protein